MFRYEIESVRIAVDLFFGNHITLINFRHRFSTGYLLQYLKTRFSDSILDWSNFCSARIWSCLVLMIYKLLLNSCPIFKSYLLVDRNRSQCIGAWECIHGQRSIRPEGDFKFCIQEVSSVANNGQFYSHGMIPIIFFELMPVGQFSSSKLGQIFHNQLFPVDQIHLPDSGIFVVFEII